MSDNPRDVSYQDIIAKLQEAIDLVRSEKNEDLDPNSPQVIAINENINEMKKLVKELNEFYHIE